jgi:hypothetical protein
VPAQFCLLPYIIQNFTSIIHFDTLQSDTEMIPRVVMPCQTALEFLLTICYLVFFAFFYLHFNVSADIKNGPVTREHESLSLP